jgi:PAS domain S-box-containing protein
VLDESGRPGGVLAVVVETTGKVLAERTLMEERAAVLEANKRLTAESTFLRELFEQAPSFMAMASGPSHEFVLANRAYQQLVGGRDVVGKTVADALPEVVGQGFVSLLDTVYETGEAHIGAGSKLILRRAGATEDSEHFLDFIYQPIRNAQGEVTGIFIEGQDVTERVRGEQHLRLVVNELNHRVKNTLAMIQAISVQTFRNAEDLTKAQANFSARIMALARANDLLTGENWEGASVYDIIAGVSVVHAGNEPDRFSAKGPMVRLSPQGGAVAVDGDARAGDQCGEVWRAVERDGARRGPVDGRERAPAHRVAREWRAASDAANTARLRFAPCRARAGGARWAVSAQLIFEPQGVVCVIEAPLDIYEGAE